MNESLQDVRRDIEHVRTAMGEKIEKLEDKIETTKNTTLNPTHYLRTYPWPILGAVTLLSCLAGHSLKSRPAKIKPMPGSGLARGVIGGVASAFLNAGAVVAANYFRDVLFDRRNGRR